MNAIAYVTDFDRKGRTVATNAEIAGRGVRRLGPVTEWEALRDQRLAGMFSYHVTDAAMARLRQIAEVKQGGLAAAMQD